jgi:ATP-dependent RNA helicase DHR2
MVACIIQIVLFEEHGDVLAFLPGQEEIDECLEILNGKLQHLKQACLLLPLYANLPP